MDIREYLEEKGCAVTNRGSDHLSTHCFFHEEETSKPGRLYIVSDETSEKYGVFWCHRCQAKGGFNRIREFFGDPPLEENDYEVTSNPIYEVAAAYYEEKLAEHPEAYKYLVEQRGLYDETIVKARLGYADGGLTTHLAKMGYTAEDIISTGLANKYGDTFKDQIIFPYMENGVAVYLRGKKIGGKTMSPPAPQPIPYGIDSVIGEKTVVLAEGEVDHLTLMQLGYASFGLPGVMTFKDHWEDYLQDAKRIYIMFDRDKAGIAGAEKLATKLGPRCRIVELPKNGIDVNDYYFKYSKQREDFDFLLNKAKGGLLVSVHEAYERWTEVEGNPDLQGLKMNLPRIDEAMTFGILPAQIFTMLARTNSGKTVMSINLFERMKILYPEIKILYISLEQTRNEWFERALRIHNFYYPGSTVKDLMDFWGDSLYLVDQNRISEQQLIDTIEQYSYETGRVPDLTSIDYLGYYSKSFSGSEYEQVTNAIMGLKGIGKQFQTSLHVPHQANRAGEFGKEPKMDEGRGGGTVEETSDVLMTLWNPDQATSDTESEQVNKGELFLRVRKSRQGGINSTQRFLFCPLTLAMVPVDDVLYQRAIEERQYALAGDTWQQAVVRHQNKMKESQY